MVKVKDNLIVLGGSGFIGHNIILKLHKKYNIYCVSKSLPKKVIRNVKYLKIDLKNLKKKHSIFRVKKPYIINLIGNINHENFNESSDQIFNEHFYFIFNFIKYLNRKNVKKFITIGSSDEYGFNKSPQNENQRESPFSIYSFSKTCLTYFLQTLHRSEGFNSIILRFFLVYGPYQKKNRLIPSLLTSLLKDEIFHASSGNQERDFLFIDDAVDLIEKILISKNKKIYGQIYNVGSGKPMTVRKIIKLFHSKIGKGKIKYGKHTLRKGENLKLYSTINKVKKIFNWQPKTSLNKSILSTIEYYKLDNEKKFKS